MIKYYMEVNYISRFGKKETRTVYNEVEHILNDEQQEELFHGFLHYLKTYHIVNTILSTRIWEEDKYKEKIDLNKLKNYECFTKGTALSEQIFKIDEEYREFKNALKRDEDIAECLDLITASINYLLMLGVTEEDFEKHIAKLERYKESKYKK